MGAKECIASGKAVLGIEFGSTRIKAVLVDEKNKPIASGAHDWENRLENGIWTYSLDDIWTGLQDCYQKLAEDVQAQYGEKITKLGAIGFSAIPSMYYVILVIMIILSAFFSASETAFSSVNLIRLRQYVDDGRPGAKKALNVAERFDEVLLAILIGNNIVNLASASLATIVATEV